jgi:diacylglycerol kinase (ATP)
MPAPAPARPRRGTLLRAFSDAAAGLADAAARERNLRIHLGLGILAAAAAALLDLTPAERGLLLGCLGAVVAAEAVNSALEVLVDVVLPGFDDRARFVKDAAAGSVLALAVASVAVAAVILTPRLGALRADAAWLALPGGAAAVAALAASLLALPVRGAAARVGLVLAGSAALGVVAASAVSTVPVLVAALLLALGAGASARAAAGRGGPVHVQKEPSQPRRRDARP